MLLKIYLLTVIISLLPKGINLTLNDIRLRKDGLYLKKDKGSFKDDLTDIFAMIISSILPILNLISGYRAYKNIFLNKYNYLLYKTDLLLHDKVRYKDRELTEQDVYNEFRNIQYAAVEDLDESHIDAFTEMEYAEKISEIVYYLKKHNIKITDDFEGMSTFEIYSYLNEIKENYEKSIQQKEISTDEKVKEDSNSNLQSEAEIEKIEQHELKLERKKKIERN